MVLILCSVESQRNKLLPLTSNGCFKVFFCFFFYLHPELTATVLTRVHIDWKSAEGMRLRPFAVVNKCPGRDWVGTETLEQAKQADAGCLQTGVGRVWGRNRAAGKKVHSAAGKKKTCWCMLPTRGACANAVDPSAMLLLSPSHNKETRLSAAAAVSFFLFTVCSALHSTLPLSHVSSQPRRSEGTSKAHGTPICLPAARQGRDRSGALATDWLRFVHQDTIGSDTQTRSGGDEGGAGLKPGRKPVTVWSESFQQAWGRAFATMPLLSNDLITR